MATPYVTFDDVIENMVTQTDVGAVLGDLVPVLQAYRVAHAVELATPMSEHNINIMLGILTGCIVATGTTLNCYPTGTATMLYFDINGNPVSP